MNTTTHHDVKEDSQTQIIVMLRQKLVDKDRSLKEAQDALMITQKEKLRLEQRVQELIENDDLRTNSSTLSIQYDEEIHAKKGSATLSCALRPSTEPFPKRQKLILRPKGSRQEKSVSHDVGDQTIYNDRARKDCEESLTDGINKLDLASENARSDASEQGGQGQALSSAADSSKGSEEDKDEISSELKSFVSDDFDSGIQIDNEQSSGVINFISSPLHAPKSIDDDVPLVKLQQLQFDENGQNRIIENALVESRRQIAEFQETWSETEQATFLEKIAIYSKDFAVISSFIATKSVKECVHYYYMTKKRENYKQKFGWGEKDGSKKGNPPPVVPKAAKFVKKRRKRSPLGNIEDINTNASGGHRLRNKAKKINYFEGPAPVIGKGGGKKKKTKDFEVDYIFGVRPDPNRQGKVEYRVMWKDYPRSESTWEPEGNLRRSPRAIQDFERRNGGK